ncbi:MAG: DUF3261 domain-containing protein [Archangium sp.]
MVLALALTSACVTAPKPKPEGDDLLLKLSPKSLGRELQLAQRITVLRGAEKKSFDAQLEVDDAEVRIAAVALGQTVASLKWDGKSLQKEVSTHVPEAITADRILSDVQLAWWPADAIRAALPNDYALTEDGGTRTLSRNGTGLARIEYVGTAPAWQHVRLAHLKYGYELDIESVNLAQP